MLFLLGRIGGLGEIGETFGLEPLGGDGWDGAVLAVGDVDREWSLAMQFANRLGLVQGDDPVRVEHALCALFPKKDWTRASDTLILHGRRICKPRPQCRLCHARSLCPSAAE